MNDESNDPPRDRDQVERDDEAYAPVELPCALCERFVRTTEHHLIPRAMHGKRRFRERYGIDEMRSRKVPLCRHCHRAVHELIPRERDLAESYATVEALLAHPGIARHVAWAKKQKR